MISLNLISKKSASAIFSLTLLSAMHSLSNVASAQWINQYPKLKDFGHHIYLEQHALPTLAHGITDPAPSPDGKSIAIASKGWIWLVDLESGIAKRLTNANGTDSRPRWSPDSKQLAFVRDYGNDTAVVVKPLDGGKEILINSAAIDMDPEFSDDGSRLFYTSGISGSLELYQRDIKSGSQQAITELRQIVRNARRVANQQGIVYLHARGAHRVLRHRNLLAGTDEIIQAQTLAYNLAGDVHPTLPLLVYTAPIDNDYHLWTMDMSDKRVKHRLTNGESFALTPAFSADGDHIYFVGLADNRQFKLMKIPTHGGTSSAVAITRWDYGSATGSLNISVSDESKSPLAARVSITAVNGHPVANPVGATYVDSQAGRTYFYVDGSMDLTLPTGNYQVIVARGPATEIFSTTVTVKKSKPKNLEVSLTPLWDSTDEGYVSADFHVHLNGDGPHRATHEDALLLMRGEDLNTLTPMSWNLWERRIDGEIIGKHSGQGEYQVIQGQEVRSGFHGHIGLLNVTEPFAPWFYGPNNPVLGNPDLTNADIFRFADKVGAFATYVHPVSGDGDPFAGDAMAGIPLELLSDGVLEEKMGLEIVCAWTSPLGVSGLWYRLLNIGRPVAAMSGTDGWVDFHRTPAVGTGRSYIRPLNNQTTTDPLLAGTIAGRSFVTTGPMLTFSLDDEIKPGDVTDSGRKKYNLNVTSTVDLETVEIIVNGQVAQTLESVKAGATNNYQGYIEVPEGGWLAARAYAATQRADSWPSMHARPFAHSSPIWIKEVGSTDKVASSTAAKDLIRAINVSEERARKSYGERSMPRLYKRFEDARTALEGML
jgi:TolB protein